MHFGLDTPSSKHISICLDPGVASEKNIGTHPDCATLKPPSRLVVGTSFLKRTLDLRHNTAVYLSCVVGGQKKEFPIASYQPHTSQS